MGWNGSLSASSANGSSIVYAPDTTEAHGYTSGAFTAPKKGIYSFRLKGSGGHARHTFGNQAAGGTGGLTVGYALMEAGQTVYAGCGGPCSAAWVANANPGNAGVAAIGQANLLFVAGAGGGGGSTWGDNWKGPCGMGGAGGGGSGADGASAYGSNIGRGGTQSAGGTGDQSGSYGTGAKGVYTNTDDGNGSGGAGTGGDGGDGYYGGGAGGSDGSGYANGGGGGSGYVVAWAAAGITIAGKTYKSTTQQGGGATSNTAGSVTVTYVGPAELPVFFDSTRLTALFFNGKEVESLIYNGTKVFARRARSLVGRLLRRFGQKRMVMA